MNPVNPSASSFAHKLQPRHLDRLAVVYIRQSTPQQVVGHRESADLQYQLRRRAVELGWPETRMLVIDDDQVLSGQSVVLKRPLTALCTGLTRESCARIPIVIALFRSDEWGVCDWWSKTVDVAKCIPKGVPFLH